MKKQKIEEIYILKAYYQPNTDKTNHNNEKLRILGKGFVEKNKDRCQILYENMKYELKEYIEDFANNYDNKGLILIYLFANNQISDMSYMFSGCVFLKSIEFLDLDTSQITDMSYMLYNCSSLTSLSDISEWNTVFLYTKRLWPPQKKFINLFLCKAISNLFFYVLI